MVFTLPMRNWNDSFADKLYLPSARFYFTYEELKLVVGLLFHFCYPGFYFTYEELKRDVWLDAAMVSGRFYFTYEELKQRNPDKVFLISKLFLLYLWGIETGVIPATGKTLAYVFTLPMRNWNWNNSSYEAYGFESFYFTYEELKP